MKVERHVLLAARLGLCVAFVYSGLSKLVDFPAAIAEQVHFGLRPPALFAALTIGVQLGGSALVLFASGLWRAVGACALAAFTALATPVGHAFWTMQGMDRFHHLNSFLEHLGLIGGFVTIAVLALRERRE
ncbi:MAG: DoxX family protein [Sinimarinibacterium flocculans]|uniref:DoxX family protein n=1 Tax=Sinimarinibacterium flocculans TaxID=985250 RepID=UPI003C4E0EE1